jgi:hypothetical protein
MAALQSWLQQNSNLNFKHEHMFTDLDDLVTPLTAAAHLARYEIVGMLLDVPSIDVNLATEPAGTLQVQFHLICIGFTPLTAACIAGNYEIMQQLLDCGGNPNCRNTAGNSFVAYTTQAKRRSRTALRALTKRPTCSRTRICA